MINIFIFANYTIYNIQLRVIHYIGSLNFGGIERLVYDLVLQQQQRNEVEVSIAVGKMKGEFKNQFKKLNIELIRLNLNSGFDLNPSKIFRMCKQFKNFDIIHLHGFHLSVVIAALFSRKKIVYTEHGNFAFGRTVKKSDKLSFWLRKQFFKHFNVSVCCNSEFTKNYVANKFYNGNRLKVVYNGVASTTVDDNSLKELKEQYARKYIIGTSSRLAGFKKIERLINCFNVYSKKNDNAILLIVGEGIKKKNLQDLTKTLNLEGKVFFLGYKSNVATYQTLFDVCVFPSKNEPFGLVAVECLEKHKPVLVFKDGGGICEVVERFNNNDICKNETEMVNRLDYYSKNLFVWEDKYQKALEFFSVQRMEKEYFNEYKNLL